MKINTFPNIIRPPKRILALSLSYKDGKNIPDHQQNVSDPPCFFRQMIGITTLNETNTYLLIPLFYIHLPIQNQTKNNCKILPYDSAYILPLLIYKQT